MKYKKLPTRELFVWCTIRGMFGLPMLYVASICFVLGAIIGSFLDVVICRFNTGKSINGRSRCFSCGHTLRWYELVPILSYVFLKGRCKECSAHIPFRLLGMELLVAVLFVFVLYMTDTLLALLLGLALAAFLVVVALYDVRHMIIPDVFVYIALLFGLAAMVLHYEPGMTMVVQYLLGGTAVSVFFGLLWLVSKGRWIGLGDVKLGFPLGGLVGIGSAFSFIVFSFWIGAGISVLLLILQRGKEHLPFMRVPLTISSEVPFAPFLILAFLLVYFSDIRVFDLMKELF